MVFCGRRWRYVITCAYSSNGGKFIRSWRCYFLRRPKPSSPSTTAAAVSLPPTPAAGSCLATRPPPAPNHNSCFRPTSSTNCWTAGRCIRGVAPTEVGGSADFRRPASLTRLPLLRWPSNTSLTCNQTPTSDNKIIPMCRTGLRTRGILHGIFRTARPASLSVPPTQCLVPHYELIIMSLLTRNQHFNNCTNFILQLHEINRQSTAYFV